MLVTTSIVTSQTELIERRPCSLGPECVIEAGAGADYKLLAPYHYRNTGFPPAVHQIYRARHTPSGQVVGAIVYAAAALNLGVRNQVFGDRYLIGGGKGTNDVRAARLNREIELIIRVIIHPAFRGIGLGHQLIAETLPLRPYRYVEMSAAMGSVNPFAEKAGMKAYRAPRPENTERVLGALRGIGLTDDQIGNPREILRALERLSPGTRAHVERELVRYGTRWIKSRTKREAVVTVEDAAYRVAGNALLATIYYVWENPAWRDPQTR